ncbi:MAG TPA: hypothetical protein VKE94_13985 [Gemmataceae bacterium]|nr:hypothetical protein [Gemmataceae bacterium]
MIIPVVIIPWPAGRLLLIVMAITMMVIIFGIFGGLYIMQAFFEPVPHETALPTPGVKVRR